MALINTWFFTKTIIDWDILRRGTTNKFRVVSVREYCDKKINFQMDIHLH